MALASIALILERALSRQTLAVSHDDGSDNCDGRWRDLACTVQMADAA